MHDVVVIAVLHTVGVGQGSGSGGLVRRAGTLLASTPTFTPTASAPGSGAIQKLLNWGGWFALAASLAGIIIGAGMWAHSSSTGSYGGVHRGKQYVLGGAIGALLLGVAPLLISTFFTTGQS